MKMREKFKFGAFSLAITILVIISVLAVNILITFVEDENGLKLDFTPTSAYSLDINASVAVRDLNKEVVIYSFIPASQSTESSTLTQNIIKVFDGASDKITSVNIDPVKNPAELEKFSTNTKELLAGAVVVAEKGNEIKNFKAYNEAELYEYNANTQKQYFVLQRWITSALIYIRTGITQNVYFAVGHGENTQSQDVLNMKSRIERENAIVQDISLTEKTLVQGDILVLLQPKSDLTKTEYDNIIRFLDDSYGRLLIVASRFVDDSGEKLKNYNNLLDYYNMSLADGVIADSEHRAADSVKHVKLIADTNHEISSLVRSSDQPVFALEASSFVYKYGSGTTLGEFEETFTPVLMSYSSSVLVPWSESANVNLTSYQAKTHSVAAAYERVDTSKTGTTATTTTRILLIGSENIATSDFLGNTNILRNGVNWLAGRSSADEIVSIGIDLTSSYILLSQKQMVTWFTILAAVVPLALVVTGIVVWFRRKNI